MVCGKPLIPLTRGYPIYILHLSALKYESTQSLMGEVLLSIFLAQKCMQGSADTGCLICSLFSDSHFQIWVALACCQERFVSFITFTAFSPSGAGWDARQWVASWHFYSVLYNGGFCNLNPLYAALQGILCFPAGT